MSVEKTPTKGPLDEPNVIGGFGQVLNHPEPDNLNDDLDLHLNPKPKFDVLEKQASEETNENPLDQFESEEEIKPSEVDDGGSNSQFLGEIEVGTRKEEYKAPAELIEYIKKLNSEKGNSLKLLLWDLETAPSKTSVFRYLDKNIKNISSEEYDKALKLAGHESPFESETDIASKNKEEGGDSDFPKEETGEEPVAPEDSLEGEVKENIDSEKEPQKEKEFGGFEVDINDLRKRFLIGNGNFIKLIKIESLNDNSNTPFIGDDIEGKLSSDINLGAKISFEGNEKATSTLQRIIEKDDKIYFQTINSIYELVADRNDGKKDILNDVPPAVEIAMEKPSEIDSEKEEDKNPKVSNSIDKKVLEPEVLSAEKIKKPEAKKQLPDIEAEVIDDKKPKEVAETSEEAPLDAVRLEYAKELKEWKASIRNKKKIFHKVLASLGVEKPLPETEKPQTLIDAEKAYLDARREYYTKTGLFEKVKKEKRQVSGQILGLREITYEMNIDLAEQALKEKELLQQMLVDGLPEKEKNVFDRANSRWKSYLPSKRAWISFGLLTGTSFVLSGVGLAGAAPYGGYRAIRMMAGTAVGVEVGKFFDGIHKKKNKKEEEEIYDYYGTYIDPTNFENKEKELSELLIKQDKKVKQRNIKKALAMMTAGGLTSASGGIANILSESDLPNSSETPITGDIKLDTPEVPSDNLGELKIDLSPKGFVEDIQNLKVKILEQYGGDENVPENIKTNILDKTSIELAKDLGLYDPENSASGLGYKGESLTLDSQGNLVLNHLDGNNEVLLDTKNSQINPFQGEMISSDLMTDEDIEKMYPENKNTPDLNDKIKNDLPKIGEEVVLSEPEAKGVPVVEPDTSKMVTGEAPLQYGFVNTAEKDGVNTLMYRNGADSIEIARENNGIMVLDDKFQNGDGLNRQIRETFAKNFGEANPDFSIFPPVNFEGGRIDIINFTEEGNPNNIKLLLNGREFARGPVGGVELLNEKGIKSGWLFGDTAYERAFKHMRSFLKTLKK